MENKKLVAATPEELSVRLLAHRIALGTALQMIKKTLGVDAAYFVGIQDTIVANADKWQNTPPNLVVAYKDEIREAFKFVTAIPPKE